MSKQHIRQLARLGIVLPASVTSLAEAVSYAMDANPGPMLSSAPNAGVPAWLLNWFNPAAIRAITAPLAAAQIFNETKNGDWETETAMFRTVEATGDVATYGDYSPNGVVGSNTTYPSRQAYHYQTWVTYGAREMSQAGAGYIDLAADKQYARALVMAKTQNRTYLRGVAGLDNYGLMNDPNIPPPVAATVNWATTTPQGLQDAVVSYVGKLIAASNGAIVASDRFVLATAPSAVNDINRTNQYGLSAAKKIQESYPNLEVVAIPEYDTDAGRLMQLWATEIDGQPTATLGYTEKMRAGAVEVYSTNWRQKYMAGTFGAIIFRPFAVYQELGI